MEDFKGCSLKEGAFLILYSINSFYYHAERFLQRRFMEFEVYEKNRQDFILIVTEFLAKTANDFQKERGLPPSSIAQWMISSVFQMCFESIEKSGYIPLKIAILKTLNILFDYYKEQEDDEAKESP